MTTFIFLRHAESTANVDGILAGRLPGTMLSKKGEQQARALPTILKNQAIDRIVSSPLERCIQTIEQSAKVLHKRIIRDTSFIEMNYGSWSGRALKDLRKEKGWKSIQKKPSGFTFPGGENFSSAARRVERALNSLSRRFPDERILIVSHGDIIKIATSSALGLKLDEFQRIVVDPCSLTIIDWKKSEKTLLHLNLPTYRSRAKSVSRLKDRRVVGGGSGV